MALRGRCPACKQELAEDAAALREHLSQCSAARDEASGAAEGQAVTVEEMLQAGYELARQSHAPAATQTATGLGTLTPLLTTACLVWEDAQYPLLFQIAQQGWTLCQWRS